MPGAGAPARRQPAGCAMRWRGTRARRRRRRDRHALDLPDPRDAGAPLRPGRLRVRDAGPRLWRDQPARHARAEGGAICRAWRAARRSRVCAVRARCRLRRRRAGRAPRAHDGDHYVLDGEKTWISNGGIADFYVVFARTGEAPGARGISALHRRGRHARLRDRRAHRGDRAASRWRGCASPTAAFLPASASAAPGEGFKVAMRTLDVFRTSVAAAALGFRAARARRGAAARHDAQDVQPDAGRLPAHPGQARADGHHHRQRRAADLPRRVAARPGARR